MSPFLLRLVGICVTGWTEEGEDDDIDQVSVLEVEKKTLQFLVAEVIVLPAGDKPLENLTLLLSRYYRAGAVVQQSLQ